MNTTNDTSTEAQVNKHLSHHGDPNTSRTAAAMIDPDEKSRLKAAVLELLAEQPMADHELIPAYAARRAEKGWPPVQPHSVARRRSELHMQGKVRDTGRRSQSPYGRPAAVWEVSA